MGKFERFNMNLRGIVEKIVEDKKAYGGITNVVWVAAGGSNAGNYPAQYFLEHESIKLKTQMYTSSS